MSKLLIFKREPDNLEWKEQFDALFMIDIDMKWKCSKCHKERDVPSDANVSQNGFNSIATEASGKDSVTLALRRSRHSIIQGLNCDKCKEDPGEIHGTLYVTGAPEILRLRLNNVKQVMVYDKTKKKMVPHMTKHHEKVRIPETLSLASFLRRNEPNMLALNDPEQGPQYTLSSVISHLGKQLHDGHWAVTVRGPEKDYGINDDYRYELDATTNSLTDNPQQINYGPEKGARQEFQAAVITYVRQHTPRDHRSKNGQKGAKRKPRTD
jgi:ubiquitin C-terminal hydrolase